ncbi:MAG: hypothetical protein NC340_10385 [Ruminococcus flavefaciens]|nr:hypothetical protein [Ruminococcus flavefaciens]MCM1229813.1 hypothetical protein [Ruminococcus flavefaciens]
MDNNRLIALACGVIVMLVVIIIGKGCMGTPDTSGLKKPETSVKSGFEVEVATGMPTTAPPVLDIFGRPVAVTTAVDFSPETEIQATETTEIQETDVFGNVITTTVAVETDFFGNEITTESTETTTEATDFFAETTTISPIEQYQNDLNNPDSIGGFNHGRYDSEGNPVPTLPPDFAIIIH